MTVAVAEVTSSISRQYILISEFILDGDVGIRLAVNYL